MLALRKFIQPNYNGCIRIFSTSKPLHHEPVVHRDSEYNNEITQFEFTQANMIRINALICVNYPRGCQRSVLGAAMDLVQRQVGWIPISAMHRVADILEIPRIRVYEWATFYTMCKRRFRGKYNVKVCVTTPCMLRGSDTILKVAEETCGCPAGEVSKDGMFGVDTVQCAGACANAPVMAIDDDYYEDLTPCDVVKIIHCIKSGGIPPAGPQSGRFAAEPISGPTTLKGCPPPPGFMVQAALFKPESKGKGK